MEILTIILMVILGLAGGQNFTKGARRFGLPGAGLVLSFKDGFQWQDLTIILFVPCLILGYGPNSFLFGITENETLTRIFYAGILSLFNGFKRWLISVVVLVGAFQVRAGSLGEIGWFGDILIEDLFRFVSLSVLILVFKVKRI